MFKQKLLNKQEPSACVVFALKKTIKKRSSLISARQAFSFLCNLHAVYLHAVQSQDHKVYKLSLFLILKFESQAKKTRRRNVHFFSPSFTMFLTRSSTPSSVADHTSVSKNMERKVSAFARPCNSAGKILITFIGSMIF